MKQKQSHSERGDFSADPRLIVLTLVALAIGGISAMVAKLLLAMIALFTQIFYYGRFSFDSVAPSASHWGIFFGLVPVLGGLLIGLMARYGSEKIRGHGIPEALEAILFGKSIMQPKVAILKPLSSAISIGSGGPFGAEGPIIMTGGAVGSILAQFLHLTAAERKTLLVAGAAAGMSAVFATPVAAVLLAVELLLFEWRPRSLVPVVVASTVAAVVRVHVLGPGPLFPVPEHLASSDLTILEAAFVGLGSGVFSALLSKALYLLEDFFHRLPIHWMWWPMLGGLAVGIGGYLEPRALGVGYDLIADFLSGKIPFGSVSALLGVKCVIWLLALASGTSGGVLAPLLIFGCGLGAIEGHFLVGNMSSATWSLVGMSAILGGMMRAPFTAVFFALELTHDYDSLMPLVAASFSSYFITVLVMKRSILTEKIARRGYDIYREYGVDPLERVRVKEAMTAAPETVDGEMPLEHFLADFFRTESRFFATSHRGFPVLVGQGREPPKLIGMIVPSDLRRIMSLEDRAGLKVFDLVQRDPVMVHEEESCRAAAEVMAQQDVGRLLVVDDDCDLVGLMTREDLLKARRQHWQEEKVKERPLAWP